MAQDLTLVPTELLPPQYAHVQFPATEYRRYQQLVAHGEVTPAGSIQRAGAVYYTTVLRAPQHRVRPPQRPNWERAAALVGVITLSAAAAVTAVTWAVAELITSVTSAMADAATLLGFLLACSFVLLAVAWMRRPRRVSGTFSGTIR